MHQAKSNEEEFMKKSPKKKKLRTHQLKAVNAIAKAFKSSRRTQCILPCGTGKSLIQCRLAQRLKPKRLLVAAPSLALVKQLLDTYIAESRKLAPVVVVCSDETTAREAKEIHAIPHVTTDPNVITKALRAKSGVAVFGTYQSTPRIAEAYRAGRVPKFDLACFDEAHRMTGSSPMFTAALLDANIPVRKRLFLTATPRIATEAAKKSAEDDKILFGSMDDESLFGKVAHTMSFAEAIDQGLLTDYRVVISITKESEMRRYIQEDKDIRARAKEVTLVRAMKRYDLRKIVTFHRSIRGMKRFIDEGLPETHRLMKRSRKASGNLWVASLDGKDSAKKRAETLTEFAGLNGDHRAVLGNCKTLNEGVDCLQIDTVAFIDAKSNPVDIVQAIGRAIRKSPKKKVATIIVPLFMPANAETDVDSFIESSEFMKIWDILVALRSHDERIQCWADSLRSGGRASTEGGIEIDIDIKLPDRIQSKIHSAVLMKAVNRFASRVRLTEDIVWERMKTFFAQEGRWPSGKSMYRTTNGSSWSSINAALRKGDLGLPGESSLYRLRHSRIGDPEKFILAEDQIWCWMSEWHNKNGEYPTARSQSRTLSAGISWRVISTALREGYHGLPGGSSLAKLRRRKRGLSPIKLLTEDLILKWMREWRKDRGDYPNSATNGFAPNGDKWHSIGASLRVGRHGLPGGSSLLKLRRQRLANRSTSH